MRKLQITRSSPDHDNLVKLYKKERNHKLKERYHALFLMLEFKNCSIVAELMKKSRKTIQTWVKLFNEEGLEGMVSNTPPGRPSRLSEEQEEQLREDISKHPRELGYEFSNWEGKNVSHHIEKVFDVEIGVRQVQRILHKLGFSLQRPKYVFPKADPEKQREFKENFKKVWLHSEKTA